MQEVHPDTQPIAEPNPLAAEQQRDAAEANAVSFRNPFASNYTQTDEMLQEIAQVRGGAETAFKAIMLNVPKSAERTLAIRKLEEALFWASKAIVMGGEHYIL